MELDPIHREMLAMYLRWRDRSPTLAGLFLHNWQRYLILIGSIALLVGLSAYLGKLYGVWFALGMLMGALARDLGNYRRVRQAWPLLAYLLDWRKVEDLHLRPPA